MSLYKASGKSFPIFILNSILTVWDLITYPIYLIIYQPWETLKLRKAKRGSYNFLSIDKVIYKTEDQTNSFRKEIEGCKDIQTVYDLMLYTCNKFRNRQCLGTRKILDAENAIVNGRAVKKLRMENAYRWNTYEQVLERVENVARGLVKEANVGHQDKVLIFADTKAEWMITTLSCFRLGAVPTTLLPTMRKDDIQFGIETERN